MRYMKKHFPEGCNLDTFGDILKEVVDKKREANKVLSELELAVQAEKVFFASFCLFHSLENIV